MSPVDDQFAQLPDVVKEKIIDRHIPRDQVAELTQWERTMAEAYERQVMADRVMIDAANARDNLLAEADRLLKRAEQEKAAQASADEIRERARQLAAEARGNT